MKLSVLDYVYGEMEASERAEFERALATDEALQQELQEVRQQLTMIRDAQSVIPMPKLSKSTSERILEFARQHAAQNFPAAARPQKSMAAFFDWSVLWRRPAVAFALTVCLTAGVVFWVAQQRLAREAAFRPHASPPRAAVALEISAPEAAPQRLMLASKKAAKPAPEKSLAKTASADRDVAIASGALASQTATLPQADTAVAARSADAPSVEARSAPPARMAPPRSAPSLAFSGAGNGGSRSRLSTVGDEFDSQSVRYQFDAAERLYAARRFPEALARYQRVAQLAYGSTEGIAAYHQAARIYSSEMQNPQKALQLYEIIMSRWPDYSNLDKVLFEAAVLYERNEDWEHAYELFKRCHDDFPEIRSQVEPHLQAVSTHVKPAP